MYKSVSFVFFVAIIAGIGLLGTYIAGDQFSPPVGGAFGFLIGLFLSIWQTLHTPKELRNRIFITYSGGRYRSAFQHDTRFTITLMLAILCAISSFIWQIIFSL